MRNASRGSRNSSSLSVSAPRTRLELTYARPDARALTEPRRAAKVRAMRRDVRADSVDAGLGRDKQAAPGVGLPRLHARDWDATWRPDDATRLRSSPTRSGRLPTADRLLALAGVAAPHAADLNFEEPEPGVSAD